MYEMGHEKQVRKPSEGASIFYYSIIIWSGS
jgi:hypothetical protein